MDFLLVFLLTAGKFMLPFERLGPYVLESALGSGGMGSVFLGVDERTKERAAVKVLAPALGADASFRERFAAEVETLKKLRHPNIVQLLGYGEQDGQLFYAMEMVDGHTLQQELQAGRHFQWREVARIGVQICQALKHAHDRGIIHRDLKPANLLYTADEQIKLADFGIAKLYGMSQLTVAGGVIGTADYMSPEQGEGKAVTSRSDLYSLGSVLFTLLARRPPFAARTPAEVLHKLRYEEPPSLRRLVPDTPKEFELIIAQLLAKDPAQRIATALAVSKRLRAMDFALSVETRVATDSDEFDLVEEEPYRLASEPEDEGDAATNTGPDTRFVTPLDRAADADADAEYLLQHRKSTVAMPGMDKPAVERPPRQETPSKETPSKATPSKETPSRETPSRETQSTHFTTFDEEARRRATIAPTPEETTPLWLRIAPLLAAVAAIVAGIWYFSRPASAESLYARIMAVAETGDSADLSRVEAEMDDYLERFPGTEKHAEIEQLREELTLYRLQRRYERQARLRRRPRDQGPVERAYVSATRRAATDPVAALGQLRALVDVYGDAELEEEDRRCLKLAREQMEALASESRDLFENELEMLRQRLAAAEAMAREHPERAHAIRQGIITLYGRYAWAQEAVERAEAALRAGASESP